MNKKDAIAWCVFVIFLLILFVAPPIMFTSQLRGLYSYDTSTFKIYMITQIIWAFIVLITSGILGDKTGTPNPI